MCPKRKTSLSLFNIEGGMTDEVMGNVLNSFVILFQFYSFKHLNSYKIFFSYCLVQTRDLRLRSIVVLLSSSLDYEVEFLQHQVVCKYWKQFDTNL